VLEERLSPATFTVTNTSDAGPGSLRQAILEANAAANVGGPDTIAFAIPATDGQHVYYRDDGNPGQVTSAKVTPTTAATDDQIADIDPDYLHSWWVIQPATALPPTTDAVVIDGSTQPGFTGTPLVELDGSLAGAGADGLDIVAGDCTVGGLVVNRFSGSGINVELEGRSGPPAPTVSLIGNYVGVDPTGTLAQGNGALGIFVVGTTGAVLQGNLASGNGAQGIELYRAHASLVAGNTIGTTAAGDQPLGNHADGLLLAESTDTRIGRTGKGDSNLISGNAGNGIAVVGNTGNVIQGNFIGTDVTGYHPIGNGRFGVQLGGDPDPTVYTLQLGGSGKGEGNIISGNAWGGVFVNGAGNVVQGNRIGLSPKDDAAVPNAGAGIFLFAQGGNTIGGAAPGAGNVIGGNAGGGIDVRSGANVIQGNWIGITPFGVASFSNNTGIHVTDTAANNKIGGSLPGEGNWIAGNSVQVSLTGPGVTYTRVQGNHIGATPADTAAGSTEGVVLNGTSLNLIGTDGDGLNDAAEGNFIAGNADGGVDILAGSAGNAIAGNTIGQTADGTALGNGIGILSDHAGANTIGGPGTGNLITFNTGAGILVNQTAGTPVEGTPTILATLIESNAVIDNGGDGIALTQSGYVTLGLNLVSGNIGNGVSLVSCSGYPNTNIVLTGNHIGTEWTDSLPWGNGADGILVAYSDDIGIEGNQIASNAGYGITLQAASNNVIQSNRIGVNGDGTAGLGNRVGVYVEAFSSNNLIGGPNPGVGNVLAGNVSQVVLDGDGAGFNTVQGNSIGAAPAGVNVGSLHGVLLIHESFTKLRDNFIAGNAGEGVGLFAGALPGYEIAGNAIGLAASGTPLGNGIGVWVEGADGQHISGNTIAFNTGDGVRVTDGAVNDIVGNQISNNGSAGVHVEGGHDNSVVGNQVSGNGGDGVLVGSGYGMLISSNAISDNGSLGIELRNGANLDQGPPTLTAAVTAGGSTVVTGFLSGLSNRHYTVEFFANDAPDPSGFGEGGQYLGSLDVDASQDGNLAFTASLPVAGLHHKYFSATTTYGGSTSTFSADVLCDVPTIAAIAATPNVFSPNGDGVKDATAISYNLSEDAAVTIRIVDGTGNLVRTLVRGGSRPAGNGSETWDGKDDRGAVVPDGSYTVTMDAITTDGISAGPQTATVVVDTLAPTIIGSVDRGPAATGWYNRATGAPVVSFFSPSPDVASITSAVPVGEGSNLAVTGTVTDLAGNAASFTVSGIYVDLTPPTLTQGINAPGATGWYNLATGKAVVTYKAADALSGVLTPAPFTFGDGANLFLAGRTVTDTAGNVSAPTADLAGIRQDTVAPVLSQSLNGPAANGWYNLSSGPAVVRYAATDATSGVATPAPFVFRDGVNQSLAGITVTDAAGNVSVRTADVRGIRQDTVAPTLTQVINAPASSGWYNQGTGPALISYTATDATSGVVTPAPFTFSDGASQSHAGITVSDAAGNVSARTADVAGINQDTAPPTVSAPNIATDPTNSSGAVVFYSGVIFTDSTSGPDTISYSYPTGLSAPSGSQFPVGTTVVSYSATDKAGNVLLGSFSVTVRPAGKINGDLWVVGGPGSDSIVINAGSRSSITVSVNSQAVPNSPFAIGSSNVIKVFGNDGDDSFQIVGSVTTQVDGGNGVDRLVAGSSGANTFRVTAFDSGTLNSSLSFAAVESLAGNTGADTFAFSDGASLYGGIDGDLGSDTLNWSAYTSPRRVTVYGVGGADGASGSEATIGSGFNNINSLVGSVASDTLQGGSGATAFNVTGTNAGNLNSNLAFSSFENLTGGSGPDSFVFANAAKVSGLVDGGGGSDTLSWAAYGTARKVVLLASSPTDGVAGSEASVAGFQNINTLTGGSASDTLQGPDASTTWNLSGANAGTVFPGNPANFSSFENLLGGAATDYLYLADKTTFSGSIDGGAGQNSLDYTAYTSARTFTLTAAGSAAGYNGTEASVAGGFKNITALVGPNGLANSLTGPNASNTWSVTGAGSGTLRGLRFAAIQNLTGGTTTDHFSFGPLGSLYGSLAGGGGANTLDLSAHTDLLYWDVTATNTGDCPGTVFTGIASLVGGSGGNVFYMGNGAGVTGSIAGGAGRDALDYASYASSNPVTVNLVTGAATNISGGVSAIEDVVGGAGNDKLTGGGRNILIGDGGNDTLTDAYTGSLPGMRCILIGGSGADVLQGGGAGDILIGGTTIYDSYNDALVAVLAEWQSADSYDTRFSLLQSGGGLNGSSTMVWGTTVSDDNAKDTLTGSKTGLDWFFAQLSGTNLDTLKNRNTPGHEHLNNTR
jgi:parallel beta-helix repeat protein